MAAADAKRPPSAYWLWLESVREEISVEIGTKKGSEVGKKAGEKWKALSPEEKAPWEAKAKEKKETFEAFKATEEGQKALAEKKAERKEQRQDKVDKDVKKAAKGVDKDPRLKKPATAYFIFIGEKREEVQKMLNTTEFGPVSKKIGELWNELPEDERKLWGDKARAQKEAYDTFIRSAEGAALLQAYKDEVNGAKEGVKGKRAAAGAEPEKKRSKTMTAGGTPEKRSPPKKKASSPASASIVVEPEVLAEAEKSGMRSELFNLAARPEIASRGLKGAVLLKALQSAKGLVNKAKAALMAAEGGA